MEKVNVHFSEKIIWLSFVMSVFVLYIHADNLANVGLKDAQYSLNYFLTQIIGGAIGGIAVPFFFMMSGYWFFRFDIFDTCASSIVCKKIKKRIKTLVIPYLIWNTVGMLFYMCVTRIPTISSMMNSPFEVPMNVWSIYEGIVLHAYYFPFWYLQNLIILVAVTPLLLYVLKKQRLSVLLLVVLAGTVVTNISLGVVKPTATFFFVLGAYLVIYRKAFFEERNKQWESVFAAIFLIVRCFTYLLGIQILNSLTLLLAPICLCAVADVIENYKITWFTKQSFFIYAAHIIPVTVTMKILAKLLREGTGAAIGYLITPLFTLTGLYVVACVLNKLAPKLYRVLCGGR